MNEAEKIIRSIKRRIGLTVVFYIVTLVVILLLGLPLEFSIGSQTVYTDGLLPFFGVLVLMLLTAFIFLILVTLQYTRVNNLLFRDCKPRLFLAVQQGVLGRRLKPVQKLISNMTVAHLTGDFKTADGYLDQLLEMEHKPKLQAALCSDGIENAYFLKDIAKMEGLLALMQKAGATPQMADSNFYRRHYLTAQTLYALAKGEYAAAEELMARAEALPDEKVVHNVQAAGSWMIQGLVHFHCDNKQKAIHAFMNAAQLGGETFIVPLSKQYLEQLK